MLVIQAVWVASSIQLACPSFAGYAARKLTCLQLPYGKVFDMSAIEAKLADLGLPLPVAPAQVGSYVPVIRTGSLVVTSGQLPLIGKQVAFEGKIGDHLHEQDGWNAARLCAVNALAQIKACLGTLEKVRQIVRVEGYVNSAPGFHAQPHVINGASELLIELFGDAGRHTRIAVGVAELPLNAAVELSIWVEAVEQG